MTGTWQRVPLLLTAALLAGCAGLGGHDQPRAEVALLGIRALASAETAPRYDLALGVRNPGTAELSFAALSYRVAIDDQEFAWGVSRQAATLPAGNEAVIDIEVTGSRFGALPAEPASAEARPVRLHYSLNGELELAGTGARLPFETRGTLDWQPAAGDDRDAP